MIALKSYTLIFKEKKCSIIQYIHSPGIATKLGFFRCDIFS